MVALSRGLAEGGDVLNQALALLEHQFDVALLEHSVEQGVVGIVVEQRVFRSDRDKHDVLEAKQAAVEKDGAIRFPDYPVRPQLCQARTFQ